MDITKLTIVELKALAYDELNKMELCQRNLNFINAELTKRAKEEPKEGKA